MRKAFLTGSKLQHRYLGLIVLSLIAPTFIVGACLYYLTFSLLAQHIAIPEFIAYTLSPVMKQINILLLIGLPVVFLALLVEGAIVSHRLAGPVDRLKDDMEDILKGDYSKRIVLRKNDDLKSVADGINELLERMGGPNQAR